MRTFVLLIGCLSLWLSSCSPALFDGMQRDGKAVVERQDLFPLFSEGDSSLLFDTKIEYKSYVFSGMLAVVPTDSGSYRLAFTSCFGLTIFDFEVGRHTFVVHNCLEQLDRKAVRSIFEQDFRTLLQLNLPPKVEAKSYVSQGRIGYKLKTDDGKCCYLVDKDRHCWLAADKAGWLAALQIRLEGCGSGLKKIEMTHPKLGLKLEMVELINEDYGEN